MKIWETKNREINLYTSCSYKDAGVMTQCYVLPTIEYYRDIDFNDGFAIVFEWLFWHLCLSVNDEKGE